MGRWLYPLTENGGFRLLSSAGMLKAKKSNGDPLRDTVVATFNGKRLLGIIGVIPSGVRPVGAFTGSAMTMKIVNTPFPMAPLNSAVEKTLFSVKPAALTPWANSVS